MGSGRSNPGSVLKGRGNSVIETTLLTSGERNEGDNVAMTAKTAMTSTQSWMTSFYRRKDSVPAEINSPEMTKTIAIKRRQLLNMKRGSTAPSTSNHRR